jgi:hypothetical protein
MQGVDWQPSGITKFPHWRLSNMSSELPAASLALTNVLLPHCRTVVPIIVP